MTTPIDTKINYCLNITARNDENSEELGVDCLLSAISKSYSQKEAAEFMAKVVMSRTDINSTSLFKSLCSEAEQRGDRDMAKDIHSAAIEMFSSKIRDDHTAQVDITELKFCLSAKLGELTKYLTAKAPLRVLRLQNRK